MIKCFLLVLLQFIYLYQSITVTTNEQNFITGFLVGITGEQVPETYSCIINTETSLFIISEEIKQIGSKNPYLVVNSLRNIYHIAKRFMNKNSDCVLFSQETKKYVQYLSNKIKSENFFQQAVLNFLKNSDKIKKNYEKYLFLSDKDAQDFLPAGQLLGDIFNMIIN